MKISDVLRKLADKIDGAEGIPDAPGNTETDDSVYLPPLQQKQELLKRAVEVAYAGDDTQLLFDASGATAFGPSTASVLLAIAQIQL